jgi:hypothetical protein
MYSGVFAHTPEFHIFMEYGVFTCTHKFPSTLEYSNTYQSMFTYSGILSYILGHLHVLVCNLGV